MLTFTSPKLTRLVSVPLAVLLSGNCDTTYMSSRPPPFGNRPPDPGALDHAASIETLKLIQAVRYSVVAVMCVLVYEWLAKYVSTPVAT